MNREVDRPRATRLPTETLWCRLTAYAMLTKVLLRDAVTNYKDLNAYRSY